ncbi:hypothetical protein SPI_06603 [Niveomyces insectorum RCEF 264]|uniref:Sac3 ganp domain containing protein n=1 Tax=Niveomyces insectorum RCEF 264 TaxID=1081102 RepID=A0A167RF20_9HYPO|nr:hypothetical protein SPI_06603 [Niveomyces insectorum RCEF 264]
MPPRRGASGGGWSRLRPVEQDPLDVYGLPSKGETRLSNFKTQERYYTKIIERYLAFCTEASDRDALLARFASLELADAADSAETSEKARASLAVPSKPGAGDGGGGGGQCAGEEEGHRRGRCRRPSTASKDLGDVLLALRKLREAIVATGRADDFAAHAYLFCIRLAILAKQPEAYHPAILHLLRTIHRVRPLTSLEHQEVVAYLVLDAACRRGDLAAAFRLRCAHRLRSATVDAVLAAVARDDWVAFYRLRRHRVDGHQAKLLEFAEHDLRVHTLKCFGRAYLRLEDVGVLEAATGLGWADLQSKYGVGWERDGRAVIIRKIQPRKPPPAAAAVAAETPAPTTAS